MDDASRPWREQSFVRARASQDTGFRPAPALQSFGETAIADQGRELDAEHLENDLLAVWLESKTSGKVELVPAEIRDVIRAVVQPAPSDEAGCQIGDMSSAIAVISDAADRLAR